MGEDRDKDNNKNNSIAYFDHSVDNFFSYMDLVTSLCRLPTKGNFQQSEIDRYSSMITFLKEWKSLVYQPKAVQFTYETGSGDLHEFDQISLPQFSSAAIPKIDHSTKEATTMDRNDYILNAGGLVWAFDWCPRDSEMHDSSIQCEYIAVAAHPPGSSTHTIGLPLFGRGVIQIWSLLTVRENMDPEGKVVKKERRGRPRKPTHDSEGEEVTKRPRGRPRKPTHDSQEAAMIKKPRGRPRKQTTDGDEEFFPEQSSVKRPRGRPRKKTKTTLDVCITSNIDLGEDIRQGKESIEASGDEHEEDASILPTSLGLNVLNKDAEPLHILNENLDVHAQTCSGRSAKGLKDDEKKCDEVTGSELQEQSFAVATSTQPDIIMGSVDSLPTLKLDGNVELSSERSRWKPNMVYTRRKFTKGLGRNTDNCTPLPGETVSTRILGGPGNLRENTESLSSTDDLYNKRESSGIKFTEDSSVVPTPQEEALSKGEIVLSEEVTKGVPSISRETSLPKLVMCFGHMGKVAWDLKWRPSNVEDLEGKHCLGYLAILLGNGSLEVWEIPLPSMIRVLYTCGKDGTDPRFLRLKPIFKCAKVKYGGNQSVPLTVEWSTAAPHDLLLAGCHDGTVALWKFSKQQFPQDVKPLLCFSADSAPIRALAWAPDERDAENTNLIVTAGHEGLKLWDLRDPYRPLWDTDPVQKVILSLEWLKEPRCFICSCDDGKVRVIRLSKMTNEVRFTGESSSTVKQTKVHCFSCSNFAVWSIQVSPSTGIASYCTADGSAYCFKLTYNIVEKDKNSPYLEPHYLCGSLAKKNEVLKVNTPLTVNHSVNEFGVASRAHGSTSKPKSATNLFSAMCSTDNRATSKAKTAASKQGKDKTKGKTPRNREHEPTFMQLVAAMKNADAKDESTQKVMEMPHKDVALHRVRWNMNKGSERWLCYGGAAGIIRCQAISLPSS